MLKIGDFVDNVKVYVVDKLANNYIVIGRDILESYDCVISYKNITFKIRNHKITLFKATRIRSNEKPLLLQCCKTVHVEPYNVVLVDCHLKSMTDHTKRVHLLTTGVSESLIDSDHLVNCRGQYTASRGQ